MMACFVLGTVTGWLLWDCGLDRQPTSSAEFNLPPKLRDLNGRTVEGDRVAARIWTDEELWEDFDRFSPAEFPLLMEALAERAGIDGLNQRERQRLQEIMERWYSEEPEEALAWAQKQEPERDRHFHLVTILHEVEERDFHAGVEFMETHLKDNGFAVNVPRGMLRKAALEGPEMFVRLCAASAGESESGGGRNVPFPVGYDFGKLMTGITKLNSELPSGYRLATYPANLMEEWVNSDPQEAYEWVNESGNNLFHLNIGHFYRAYGNLADAQEYGEFVAEGFSLEQDSHRAAESALLALAYKTEYDVMDSFLKGVPAERRSAVLEGIYAAADGRSASGIKATRIRVLEQMGAEGRVEFLRRQDAATSIQNGVPGILLGLGHSQEEVRELIPDPE